MGRLIAVSIAALVVLAPRPASAETRFDVIVTKDGVTHIGTILSSTDDGFRIRDRDGKVESIPMAEVSSVNLQVPVAAPKATPSAPKRMPPPTATPSPHAVRLQHLRAELAAAQAQRQKAAAMGTRALVAFLIGLPCGLVSLGLMASADATYTMTLVAIPFGILAGILLPASLIVALVSAVELPEAKRHVARIQDEIRQLNASAILPRPLPVRLVTIARF